MNDDPLLPVELPDEYAAAIGAIAVAWTHLEHLWEIALWGALKLDHDAGRSLTTHVGTTTRLDILISLHMNSPHLSQLKAFVRRFEDLRPLRNRYVHAEWVLGENKPHAINWEMRRKWKLRAGNDRDFQIRAVADDINQLSRDLLAFLRFVDLVRPDAAGPPGLRG